VPFRRQLLLKQDSVDRSLHRDDGIVLLLQFTACPHHQRTGAQPDRPRLGRAESPDCSGFTIAQLQSLNFAQMDLSEFYAEIAPTLPNNAALQNAAQQKINSYYSH